jgi:hypothetical protein
MNHSTPLNATAMRPAGLQLMSAEVQYAITLGLSTLSACGGACIIVAFLHAQKWSDARAARLIFYLGVFNFLWFVAYACDAAVALLNGGGEGAACGTLEVASAVFCNLSMVWSCAIAADLCARVHHGADAAYQRWRFENARQIERGYLGATLLLASMLVWPHFAMEPEGLVWECQVMFGDNVRSNANLGKLLGPCLAFFFNWGALLFLVRATRQSARVANVAVRARWTSRMLRFLGVFTLTWAGRVASLLANAAGAPPRVSQVLTLVELLTFPAAGLLNAWVYGNHPWLRRSCKTCLVFYGCFNRLACCCLREVDATFVSVGFEKDVRFCFNGATGEGGGSAAPPSGVGWSDAFDADAPRREARDFLLCEEDKIFLFEQRPDLDRENWLEDDRLCAGMGSSAGTVGV